MKWCSKSVTASAVVLLFSVCAPVHASMQMAVDYGCLNCHGAYPRGEAPSFERLADKLVKYKGDDAALAAKVASYRAGEPMEHIEAHERISLDAATRLLRWLAEGGK